MDMGEEHGMMGGDGEGIHLKRSHDEDDRREDGNKRHKGGSGPRIEIRLLILGKNAGAIIGKGGENIKRLRTDYSASVTVPDSHNPERILSLTAQIDDALECLLDIIPNLEEYQKFDDLDFDAEIRFLVHQSQAGCVIGRGGSQIKQLREETKTNIKVHQDPCPESTDRVVQVNGPPKLIVQAVRTIYGLLENAPPKGPINPYDPYNYEEFNVENYGGFPPFDNRRGGRGGRGRGFGGGRGGGGGRGVGGGRGGFRDFGNSRGGAGGGGGGFDRNSGAFSRGGGGGRFNRDSGSAGGGFGSRGGNRGGGAGFGSSGGGGGAFNQGFNRFGGGAGGGGGGNGGGGFGNFGGGGGNFNRGNDSGFAQDNMNDIMGEIFDSKTTTQVTIPNDYAGLIIGPRGERIKNIRMQSNTQINIDEAVAGCNDRIITIIGRPEHIQHAQFLLQQAVREFKGK